MEEEGKLPSSIIGYKGVHAFADFYEKFPEEISKMKSACLIQYCEDQEFTKEEYEAFKQGVATIIAFLQSSHAESNVILREKAKLKK